MSSQSSDLEFLGRKHGTDKVEHQYLPHFERRFNSMRHKSVKLLEIGIMDGASLRMWKEYFSNGQIYGIDVLKKRCFFEERIDTFCGNQADEKFLQEVANKVGQLDIVIDDGSHKGVHHVASFRVLWPIVKSNGWYCIEDCQSLFNDCWTQPTDYTILNWVQEQWEPLLRGRSDVGEVNVIGDGINDGLICFRKRG